MRLLIKVAEAAFDEELEKLAGRVGNAARTLAAYGLLGGAPGAAIGAAAADKGSRGKGALYGGLAGTVGLGLGHQTLGRGSHALASRVIGKAEKVADKLRLKQKYDLADDVVNKAYARANTIDDVSNLATATLSGSAAAAAVRAKGKKTK